MESKTYDERGVELYKVISDATYNYMLGKLDKATFAQEIERWKRGGGARLLRSIMRPIRRSEPERLSRAGRLA